MTSAPSSQYVLGVDGGNTKTIALVATHHGEIVGRGRSGCGDIYGHLSLGPARSAEVALSQVETSVGHALAHAGIKAADITYGVFSMAGADWPEDFDLLRREMLSRSFGSAVMVVNDAIGALRAGTIDGMGVSVVCGTGLAIGARATSDKVWHHSFWQEGGGSLYLGQKALRAVYRAELGINPPTALTGRVLQVFGQSSVDELLHRLTRREGRIDASAAVLGDVTRALLDEASGGDPVAVGLVREYAAMVGDYALAAARRVGIEREAFPLVLAGGVLRNPSPHLTEGIVERVKLVSPAATPVNSRFEPAVGAVLLALEAVGTQVDELLLARLLPALPEPSLYLT